MQASSGLIPPASASRVKAAAGVLRRVPRCTPATARDQNSLFSLIYPMIDDRTAVRKDLHPYVGEFIWTQANNYFGWRSLLGEEPGSADVSPYGRCTSGRCVGLASNLHFGRRS